MKEKKGKTKPDPEMASMFSRNLKSLIKTNKELADKIGVSEASVSEYVNEIALPRADILYRISRELKKSMEWLLTGLDFVYTQNHSPNQDNDLSVKLTKSLDAQIVLLQAEINRLNAELTEKNKLLGLNGEVV